MIHIRLAQASEDVLAGALRTACKLRVEENTKAKNRGRRLLRKASVCFVPSATLPTVLFGQQRPSYGWLLTSFFCGQRLKQPSVPCVLPIVLVEQLQSGHGLRLRWFFCRFGCCLPHSVLKLRC